MTHAPGTTHLSASEQLRRIIASEASGTDSGLIFSLAKQLDAELRAATAAAWTDPANGSAYDLSVPWRDADGAYWRHAGWVGLPGEPRVPLMLWSASRDLPEGGIRRMSDLATMRGVIDDCGPLTPATTIAGTEETDR